MAETTPKSTPKDVFYHLLSIVTLYASVISFIALLWQYINVWYPDPLNYYYAGILSSVRWSASVLVVMFPVYVLMAWLINKDFKVNPGRREIKVRKWLVYLTLFISAITVIVDIITLVYNLLGGEVTPRFLFKVLAVLITAAAVFGYYLWDLRKDGSIRNIKILAGIVSVIVAGVVIGAFFLVGSPAHQRELNFDERRVSDLQMIQNQTVTYWQQKNKLPATLSDLTDSISGFTAPKDPETNSDYEYNVLSDINFQLCANFNLPSQNTSVVRPEIYPYYNWDHGAGLVCFDRTIDPQLYGKPVPVPLK